MDGDTVSSYCPLFTVYINAAKKPIAIKILILNKMYITSINVCSKGRAINRPVSMTKIIFNIFAYDFNHKIEAMKFLYTSSFIFILFSCIEKFKEQKNFLAGKIYNYGPEFDSTHCEATGACDCCGGNYYFINDSEYIDESVCVTSASYIKGKYKLNKDTLYIISDSILVYYGPDILINESSNQQQYVPDSVIKVEKISPHIVQWKMLSCRQKKYFFNVEDKFFATEDTSYSMNDAIKNLINSGIFSKLNMLHNKK